MLHFVFPIVNHAIYRFNNTILGLQNLLYHYMAVYTNCFFLIIRFSGDHINIIMLLLGKPS